MLVVKEFGGGLRLGKFGSKVSTKKEVVDADRSR